MYNIEYPKNINTLIATLKELHFKINEEYNESCFGNTVIYSVLNHIVIRIIRDRSQWFIEIRNPYYSHDCNRDDWLNINTISLYCKSEYKIPCEEKDEAIWLSQNIKELINLLKSKSFVDNVMNYQRHRYKD